MKVDGFEKKGLIYEESGKVISLTNIGRMDNRGDFILSGCANGAIDLYDLSILGVCCFWLCDFQFLIVISIPFF